MRLLDSRLTCKLRPPGLVHPGSRLPLFLQAEKLGEAPSPTQPTTIVLGVCQLHPQELGYIDSAPVCHIFPPPVWRSPAKVWGDNKQPLALSHDPLEDAMTTLVSPCKHQRTVGSERIPQPAWVAEEVHKF